MEAPRVTTLAGFYNHEAFVENFISHFMSHKYPKDKHHLFLIDNCSADDTYKKLYELTLKKIPHSNAEKFGYKIKSGNGITIMRTPEVQPASVCWNAAIELTKSNTDVYSKIGGNDLMKPDKTMKCVQTMMQDKARIGVVYADYDSFDVQKHVYTREFKPPYSKRLLARDCCVFSESFFNTDVVDHLKEVDGYVYDEAICGTKEEPFKTSLANYDLWIRISNKFMICHIPESLTCYTIPQSNEMESESFKKSLEYLSAKMVAR